MLQRTADWIGAGGGNDKVRAWEPGSAAAGSAGRDGVTGTGTGGRRQGIGSRQTCPVGPGARVVVAGRCWWRSASRGRSCRGHTGGGLARPAQMNGDAIEGRQVQGTAKELSAGRRGRPLNHREGFGGDFAVRRGFRRGSDGVRGCANRRRQHCIDRHHHVKDRQVRDRRTSRLYPNRDHRHCLKRVRHQWICHQRVGRRRNREGWIYHRQREIQGRVGYDRRWCRSDHR
ncbi:hypothetical protein BJQ90_03998 [Arthrobacter sp. SO3]|nr:hypothetical protein [Arthrobacter sp. SO3]